MSRSEDSVAVTDAFDDCLWASRWSNGAMLVLLSSPPAPNAEWEAAARRNLAREIEALRNGW